MTRSSRHKSSKHRDVREYSDSEKDLSAKDRKDSGGGGARVSSEKRKLDLKEGKESGNGGGEYAEDLVSSKRRKERGVVVDDGGSDRWNGGGGEYDHREGSKKSSAKGSGDSKSRKRDGSVEMYGEVKKSSSSGGGKSEGKHRDKESSRKEGREGGGGGGGGVEREKDREREKKSKDGRSGGEDQRMVAKQVNDITDLNGRKELESPEPESQIDRHIRKRRDDSGDTDKHLDYVEDINGGRLSSRDDLGREGRQKDEKRKDERYREKFREDMDRDSKPQDEKQRDEKLRDERSTKDHLSSKSEDKHLRDEKDTSDMQQKRSKLQDGERKGEHERDRNRDRDLYHVRERERYHDREHGWDHGRDRDYDRDWDCDRERDGERDRERNHDRERARDRDRDGERDRDRDYDRDYDGSHLDDRSVRYKDSSRGKRRSPEDRDDSIDTKSRGVKPRYSDFEKKSSGGDRVESDVNKGRSQSRQGYADTILSNKRRTSPSSYSNAGIDEYRYANPEETKYRDSMADQRSKALPPRDVSGVTERGSKYRSMEKSSKMDDSHLGELSNEKTSGSKASPMALMERSPSSSSIDRRYMNKTAGRRSIDIEETGRRSSASMDNRDFSNTEDRQSRDLPSEKAFMGDTSPADSSAHNRSGQSNFSSPFAPHPNFRAGVESPSFAGSVEDDGRVNSSARYRRSSDPNLVRGPWRGVPNWPSPVPNGFMPFPHGGPHGGFQGMLPQFSAPPIFGVRPPMEINHYAMPFQITDDRFSGHMRPLGSQNIMEGLGPSHMHSWDGSTGAFRDDCNSYGAEWDQNRHPMSARGWDPSAEPWKAQNNDVKRDLPSPSPRNDYPSQTLVDDGVAGQVGQMSHHEDNLDLEVHSKTAETRSTIASPSKESTTTHEKSRDGSKLAIAKVPSLSHYYLSKLDISAELAHTELYSQCMSLLDTERSATVEEDPTMHTILKAATAGLKSSKTLLSSSLFPPLKDSVFQKAMDLYKKQRMEAKGMSYVAGGRLDVILALNQKNMEAKEVFEVEKVDPLALKSDEEMADAAVSSVDEKTDSVEEKLNELVSVPGQEMQNDISLGSPKLEMAVEDSTRVEPGEPQTIPNGLEMDSESSEQVKLQVDTADGFSILDNEASLPATTTTLSAIGNNMSKVQYDNSIHHAEEGVAVDAIRGPSVIPDGSPKACEALMSGSNESDSVILSRIHHSPESTTLNPQFFKVGNTKKEDEMEQQLLSMKDFEGKPIRPHSSYLDILIQVASVYRNILDQRTKKKLSTHSKTKRASIEPISVEGKERYAKVKKLNNSVIESVTKIGGSKRKGFDNADDYERGFQFKKQKMDMDSSSESKKPSSSVRKESKMDALYSVGIVKTENSLPIKKKSSKGGDDKQWDLTKDVKSRTSKKESIDANDLPEEYKRKIENFDKAKATLVIQKELTNTDFSHSACRLSMPMNQIKPESFLNVDEIKFLARNNDWPVSVIDPLLEEEDLVLRQWDMKKPTGKTSSSYMLKTRWNEVADKNKLQPKDVIQVWSFRDMENNLHFPIVLVKKAEENGGERSNSEGSSQPSPPSTTSPRDFVDGESSGSGQDIDGERSSGRDQGTETKEESTIRGNSNDENNSGRITMSNGFNDNHES